jgi:fumarate hydratase, class II
MFSRPAAALVRHEHERSSGYPCDQKLGKEVHPNDHVNASQSSNDVFPTSVHVAVTNALVNDLLPALDYLAGFLEVKAKAWAGYVKPGRTHLMDATR